MNVVTYENNQLEKIEKQLQIITSDIGKMKIAIDSINTRLNNIENRVSKLEEKSDKSKSQPSEKFIIIDRESEDYSLFNCDKFDFSSKNYSKSKSNNNLYKENKKQISPVEVKDSRKEIIRKNVQVSKRKKNENNHKNLSSKFKRNF